jgi:amino acid transporter
VGFKTRIVKPSEMNFSAAVVFDEMEQADRIAALEEKAKHGKKPWLKRVQYMVFG